MQRKITDKFCKIPEKYKNITKKRTPSQVFFKGFPYFLGPHILRNSLVAASANTFNDELTRKNPLNFLI